MFQHYKWLLLLYHLGYQIQEFIWIFCFIQNPWTKTKVWHREGDSTLHVTDNGFPELHQFSSVESISRVWLFATPWTAARQASLSITNSWSLLKLIRWPKYQSFSFSIISPSSEYSGLSSFRMDWLDILAVQRTLKSLLQHHSSKASVVQCSAFFMVQLSYTWLLEKP